MSNWQPIATAPKGIVQRCNNSECGAKILAWPIYGSVSVVYWWQWRKNSGEINGSNFLDEGGNAVYPSHWMPLPEPPSEDKTK